MKKTVFTGMLLKGINITVLLLFSFAVVLSCVTVFRVNSSVSITGTGERLLTLDTCSVVQASTFAKIPLILPLPLPLNNSPEILSYIYLLEDLRFSSAFLPPLFRPPAFV